MTGIIFFCQITADFFCEPTEKKILKWIPMAMRGVRKGSRVSLRKMNGSGKDPGMAPAILIQRSRSRGRGGSTRAIAQSAPGVVQVMAILSDLHHLRKKAAYLQSGLLRNRVITAMTRVSLQEVSAVGLTVIAQNSLA